jgi:Sec-independent protein secretion pathway component TatC
MPEPLRSTDWNRNEERLDAKMGFLEHLDELRTRLIRYCAAVVMWMAASFAFVDRIADFVLAATLRCSRKAAR